MRTAALLERSWRAVEPPPAVTAVPSMLSKAELALLYVLARDHHSGEGAIVDAGCFLGGSTVALAAGLRDRDVTAGRATITSYDRFEVEPYFFESFGEQLAGLAAGDDFRHLFEENVAPYANNVEVKAGDILAHPWTGGPIEILFLDVIKTWEINDFVLQNFFPNLIPGRSVVIQQDFHWAGTPWIHITMELLADHFEMIDDLPPSRVYALRDEIPEDALEHCREANLSWSRQNEVMRRTIASEDDAGVRGMLELSAAWLPIHRRRPGAVEFLRGRILNPEKRWETLIDEIEAIAPRYADQPLVQSCAEFCLRYAQAEIGRVREASGGNRSAS